MGNRRKTRMHWRAFEYLSKVRMNPFTKEEAVSFLTEFGVDNSWHSKNLGFYTITGKTTLYYTKGAA